MKLNKINNYKFNLEQKMTTERIKEIQLETGYPDSVSVQQALLKVWNETEQESNRLEKLVSEKFADTLKEIDQIIDEMDKKIFSNKELDVYKSYETLEQMVDGMRKIKKVISKFSR